MRRFVLAPIAGILLLALVPGPALALTPGDLDQNSELVGHSLGSGADQAQTFTAGRTGFLDDVELYFNGSGTITMTIQQTTAGLPNGTILATATATPGSSPAWIDFVFASPASVTSGTMYAICFNTGVAAAVWGTNVEDPDNYVPGAAAFGVGGIWAPSNFIGDFAFRTYVRLAAATPTPTPTPTATPPPTASVTPPPTSTGEPGSPSGTGSLPLLLAGLAAFSGMLLLAARQKRASRI